MPDQETQAHSELASFGEELRREREIRGISLKEIADATKISKRFLEAIERNDHRTLPAPVFTRGFVREYARYLGLQCEEMVNRYNFAAAGDDRIEKSAHLQRLTAPPPVIEPRPDPARFNAKPEEKRGIPPPYARIDRNVYLLVIIVAALLGVAWWALQHKRAEAEVAATDTALPPATRRAARPVVQTPPPPPPAPKEEPLRLTIELIDDAWIDLQADGQTVMKDEYPRGTRNSFDAKESFHFNRIGNAAGVILMLNDKQLPPLGRDGQVIKNRVYDRAFYEKLKAAPSDDQQ